MAWESRNQGQPAHIVKRAIDADLDGSRADRLALVVKLERGNVPIRMQTRFRSITVQRLGDQEEPGLIIRVLQGLGETLCVPTGRQMRRVQVEGPVLLDVIVRDVGFEPDPDPVQQATCVSDERGMREDDGGTLVGDVGTSKERRDFRVYGVRNECVSPSSDQDRARILTRPDSPRMAPSGV